MYERYSIAVVIRQIGGEFQGSWAVNDVNQRGRVVVRAAVVQDRGRCVMVGKGLGQHRRPARSHAVAVDVDARRVNVIVSDKPVVNPTITAQGVVDDGIHRSWCFARERVEIFAPSEVLRRAAETAVICEQIAEKIVVVRQQDALLGIQANVEPTARERLPRGAAAAMQPNGKRDSARGIQVQRCGNHKKAGHPILGGIGHDGKIGAVLPLVLTPVGPHIECKTAVIRIERRNERLLQVAFHGVAYRVVLKLNGGLCQVDALTYSRVAPSHNGEKRTARLVWGEHKKALVGFQLVSAALAIGDAVGQGSVHLLLHGSG